MEKKSVLSSPFIRGGGGARSVMADVIIALLPSCAWGIYRFGLRAALILAISVIFSVISESVFCAVTKKKTTVGDLSAIVTGMIFGMSLSVAVPLWVPAAGSVFAVVIGKEVFGGLGKNPVNPALFAKLVLLAVFPQFMTVFPGSGKGLPAFSLNCDAEGAKTPLSLLKNGNLPDITKSDLFMGKHAGAIGEVGAVFIILGGAYLLVRGVISWHIPVSFIGTAAVLFYFFPRGAADGKEFLVSGILSGGLLLGAFFMATDSVTSPVTPLGKFVFGAGCGALTVLFRYYGGFDEGVCFAIPVMDVFTRPADRFLRPAPYGCSVFSRFLPKTKK